MKDLLIGALIISMAPIAVRSLEFGPAAIGGIRNFFGGLVLIFLMRRTTLSEIKTALRSKRILFFIFAGIIFAIDMYLWNRSIKMIGAGMATLLANTQVFYMAFYGKVFEKEKLSFSYYIGLLLSFTGVIGISNILEVSDTSISVDGIMMALIAGICYALTMILFQKGLKSAPISKGTTPFYWGLISVVTGLSLLPFSVFESWPSFNMKSLGVFLALIFLIHALGWKFISMGISKTPISLTGLILLCQPALSLLWGWIIFDEVQTSVQLTGTVLVFTGLVFATLGRKRSKSK